MSTVALTADRRTRSRLLRSSGATPEISYVGRGTAVVTSALSITGVMPAGIVANDYLIFVVAHATSSDVASGTNCSGSGGAWTRLIEWANTTPRNVGAIFAKKYNGSEGAPTANMNASAKSMRGQVYAFRGVDPTTAIDQAAAIQVTTTAVAPSMTTTFAGGLSFQVIRTPNNNNPWVSAIGSGHTLAGSGADFSNVELGVAYAKLVAPVTTQPTWTVPTPASGTTHTIALALRPA